MNKNDGAPTPSHAQFLEGLKVLGVNARVYPRPPADSLAASAAALGIEPGNIVKSLVLKSKDGSYLFALVPGDRQISWPRLRALLGVNKVSMPSADAALAVTGYERGTITPVGAVQPLPVYADERLRSQRIHMGAGQHGMGVELDADELLAAMAAQQGGVVIADISDPLA